MTSNSDLRTGRVTSSGWRASPAFFARSAASSAILRVYASASVARLRARWNRDVAISSIVLVIFRMFRTALRRFTRARRFAIPQFQVPGSKPWFWWALPTLRSWRVRHAVGGDDEDQVLVAPAFLPPADLTPSAAGEPAVAGSAGFGLDPRFCVGPVVPRELDLVGPQAVQVDLRQVPVDPHELGHASFLLLLVVGHWSFR